MLFAADTGLSCIVKPGLGFKREKLQRYARGGYSAIVIHTTGRGVHKKANRWAADPWAATLRIYAQQTDASGHYVIGQNGQIGQVVPEDVVAWHVGGRGGRKYHRADWWAAPRVAWWRKRWPQYVAPGQLAHGRLWAVSPTTGKPSCNSNTIGIEVVPPEDNGAWSELAWKALCQLCWDISGRREIQMSAETVITHSDAHPLSRSAKGKPWDPASPQWTYARFSRIAGLPQISGVGIPLTAEPGSPA